MRLPSATLNLLKMPRMCIKSTFYIAIPKQSRGFSFHCIVFSVLPHLLHALVNTRSALVRLI